MASSGTTSTRKRFTGAEFIVHFLEQQGIKIVTGIPGGSILPVYDALSQSTQIRHILARHEQGAGFIAQGMARTDGKPAVCMACSGPGATNLVTAIADARLDSIPLICITGQVPASMIGTDAFQEVDTYGISIPITKHNYLVRHIEELPQVMSDAFRIAQSGRPGPVWIDIPKDVQTAVFEIEAQPAVAEKAAAPAFSEESIRDAAAMINAAKRPVLYLGGGVINAPARVRELAEKAQLPTTMTLMALGMLPKAHPLSLGMLGMHGVRAYTATPGNLSSDLDREMLRWVEMGYMPYFELTWSSTEELMYTDYQSLFTAQYSAWLDKVSAIAADFADGDLHNLRTALMMEHTKISSDLIRVRYDNGMQVYVNYADHDQQADGLTIPAMGYLVTKEGAQ